MTLFMVDIETDGGCPHLYSMISFGAVIVQQPRPISSFYGLLQPISYQYDPKALTISGFTREQTQKFPDPKITMLSFYNWIKDHAEKRPYFIADNNGFDWQFINYYFIKYIGKNPFGHSSLNLNCLYWGMQKRIGKKNFKHLRKTKHTHNPVDDARGNAEALLQMIDMGLNIDLT